MSIYGVKILADVNGTLFFSAYDGVHSELWKSDGTEAGTVLVKEINVAGTLLVNDLTNLGGTLYFSGPTATDGAPALWKSDGTAAGTVVVKDGFAGTISELTPVGGILFFSTPGRLNIYLKQANTYGMPVWATKDFDGNIFFIRPWEGTEWSEFQRKFREQALRWNGQFWLIPPAGYSRLDIKGPNGLRTRPNIWCLFDIQFQGGTTSAHRVIEVVNLNQTAIKYLRGVDPADQNSGLYRSDDRDYDSLDVTPRTNDTWTSKGLARQSNYLTVVHEIGHAIGLPHIGVSKHDPLCKTAILFENNKAIRRFGVGTRPSATARAALTLSHPVSMVKAAIQG